MGWVKSLTIRWVLRGEEEIEGDEDKRRMEEGNELYLHVRSNIRAKSARTKSG